MPRRRIIVALTVAIAALSLAAGPGDLAGASAQVESLASGDCCRF